MFDCKPNFVIIVLINCVFCQIGPPTQPTWTVDKDISKKPVKVEVNLKNLLETASIRTEIESAVNHHKYAIGGEDEDKIVHEADEELGEDFRSRNHHGLIGSSLDTKGTNSDVKAQGGSQAAPSFDWLKDVVPNKVASSLVDGGEATDFFIPEYKASNYHSDNEGREVLVLNGIEEEFSYDLPQDVDEWKAMKNGDLLGISRNRMILVQKTHGVYQVTNQMDFRKDIESMEVVSHRNQTSQTYKTYAVVSLDSSLQWIDLKTMVTVWIWPVGSQVYSIQKFDHDHHQYLVALTGSNVIVFQYNLSRKEYFSTQTISIETSTRQMVFLDPGYHKILALPQNNKVLILQSDDSSSYEHIHFSIMPPIPADDITSIHAFQTGGYSYLAVGGNTPRIYRYHYGSFKPQTILDSNFGIVDLFLAVPCSTYRDDLVLLVQHRVEFETHSINVVEPLIWNGEAFETTKSVPCKVGSTIELFGASCILDLEREQGLQGAAVISHQGEVLLVVPRYNAPSGLFRLFTELVPRSPEIEDLQQILKQMETMIANQDKIMDLLDSNNLALEKLQTKELSFNGDVEKLFLNGQEWTKADSEVDLDLLFEDMVNMQKQIDDSQQDLRVKHVTVEELFLENLNNEMLDQLKEINFQGTVVVDGDLSAYQFVQLPFKELQSSEDEESLDILEIHGDLIVDVINGVAWEDIMEEIVFKDTPAELGSVNVEKVVVDGDIKIDSINGLNFPNDFLLSNGPKSSLVTGKKEFVNTLSANAMDCEDTINNIDPANFITLGHEQFIPGTTTFTQLEVTNSFEINGTISGKDLDQFVSNPTLKDTYTIIPECQFKNLIVDGPITIKGLYNDVKFDDVLDDVIYMTDQNVSINSQKIFDEIHLSGSSTLGSNSIGDISLYDFLTKSTEQELSVEEIEGDLKIVNLELKGLYNSVNVTELELDSIKLDQDQKIDISIVFKDPNSVEVTTVEVLESLNGVPVENYMNIKEPIYITDLVAEELIVDQLISTCDINGEGDLNAVNLEQFDKHRFSLSLDQTISADIIADHVIADLGLNVTFINGFPAKSLPRPSTSSADKYNLIKSAKHIKVLGDVQVSSINGQDIKELWSDVIWLDRPNIISTHIEFLDSVYFQDDVILESGRINDQISEEFFDNLVLKDRVDQEITIKGTKRFLKPIEVLNDATIHFFNNISADHLITKFKPIRIEGDLTVDGDLFIPSLDVEGDKFGNYSVREIFEMYQYDPSDDMHYISGTVHFSGSTTIDRLHVGEKINGQTDIDNMFAGIVYKNDSGKIIGKKIFENQMTMDQGVHVELLNGVHLPELLEDIYYINQVEPIKINGPVVFQSAVSAEHIYVEGNVHANRIMGCSLQEWLQNCLHIDLPVHVSGDVVLPSGLLDGSKIYAEYLNNIPMKDVITLNTPQNLTGNIHFPYMHLNAPMKVLDKINNIDLIEEFKNTFMVSCRDGPSENLTKICMFKIFGNQNISAPIEAKTLFVRNNLKTLEPINNYDLREVATIHSNIHLRSSISFENVETKNIYTNDLISGLNFSDWHENSLKFNTTSDQKITGVWSINELIVNTDTIMVNPPLTVGNGTDLITMSRSLQKNYDRACKEIMQLRKTAAERVSFLKLLRLDHETILVDPLDSIHAVVFNDASLLLLNKGYMSEIYLWYEDFNQFLSIVQMNTGRVLEVHTLENHHFAIFSEIESTSITDSVQTIWKLENKQIVRRIHQKESDDKTTATRTERSIEHSLPDFNVPIADVTKNMLEGLQSMQDDSPFVGSDFSDKMKDVAKKLLTGLTHLDDVKTIVDHAHKIYHTVLKSNDQAKERHTSEKSDYDNDVLHHDHKNPQNYGKNHHGLNDHLDFSDSNDHSQEPEDDRQYHSPHYSSMDMVGAAVPPLIPAIPSLGFLPVDTVQAMHRLQALLHAIPHGFQDFVSSTSTHLNGNDFQSQLRTLMTGITKVFYNPDDTNIGSNQRRNSPANISVTQPLDLLQQYAETDYAQEDQEFSSTDSDKESLSDTNISNDQYRHAISFEVGSQKNRQKLIAVISPTDLQSVRLYYPSLDGEVFQILGSKRPRMLAALEIQDETILAFVDGDSLIRVMKYKGVQGFVEWSTFVSTSEHPVTQLLFLSLTKNSSICRSYYLISVSKNRVQFFEIVMGGMCPIKYSIKNCNGWW